VAVICISEERLRKIEAAVTGGLGAKAASQVEYFQPDQFIAHLQALQPPAPPAPEAPTTRRGYKVRRSVSKLTPEEQIQREKAGVRSIAVVMRSDEG